MLSNDGLVKALPFLVLVGLVVLTSWFQQRQIAGRNPNAAANPQQQMIGKIMPFIFVPISFGLPAGVVLYFVTSNMVRIGQQALITKMEFGKDKDPGSGTSENGAKPKDAPARQTCSRRRQDACRAEPGPEQEEAAVARGVGGDDRTNGRRSEGVRPRPARCRRDRRRVRGARGTEGRPVRPDALRGAGASPCPAPGAPAEAGAAERRGRKPREEGERPARAGT